MNYILGMAYVASKFLVHRDLAARNVLIFDNFVAKISDFGLCCSLEEAHQSTVSKKLPIKWLSIEVLTERCFSEKSDVWAFGVLMYEMFTFGTVPYETMNNDELVIFLQSGARLECPPNINNELCEIMLACWKKDPTQRPSFIELEQILLSLK